MQELRGVTLRIRPICDGSGILLYIHQESTPTFFSRCYAAGTTYRQMTILNLRVKYPVDTAMLSDDVKDTVNYATVYSLVKDEMNIESNL